MLNTEYTQEEFEALIPEVDTATADNLYAYFSLRTPIDNFEHFLHQTVLEYNDQYVRMLRDESVEYDTMVTDYIERLTKGKSTNIVNGSTEVKGSNTGSNVMTNTGTDTVITDTTDKTTETPNTTTVADTSTSNNGSRTNTGTQTNAMTNGNTQSRNNSSGDMDMSKTNPMSITYSSFFTSGVGIEGGSGMPGQLDWSTSDRQQQNYHAEEGKTTDSGHEDTTRTDNLSESTSDSGTGKTTTSVSGTNTTDNTGKQTTTTNRGTGATTTTEGTNTSTTTDNSTTTNENRNTDRYTGRHGYSPAELLTISRDYILLMKSFKWYCEKFNKCFVWSVEL